MKLGYPCINTSLSCTTNKTFRLASFTKERFLETVKNNLACLQEILQFNVKYNLLFFRISSNIIPFASHPINTIDWTSYFRTELQKIGDFIKQHNLRISMHPDQFVLLNSPHVHVLQNSLAELSYHCTFLDALGLDQSAKVQIHVGGIYGKKIAAMHRFVENYKNLPRFIKKRLVIENDDRLYSVADCLILSQATQMPVLLDTFHHECLNNGESLEDAFESVSVTWRSKDGVPMLDYSTQEPNSRKGKHATSINLDHFKQTLRALKKYDCDILLEIKNKEKSALQARSVLKDVL